MTIEKSISSQFAVNTYYLIEGQDMIIIDPVKPLCFVQHHIDFVILTHEHYDHIYSVNSLKEDGFIKIMCGEKAQIGMSKPSLNLSKYVEFLRQFIPFGTGEVCSCEFSCNADYVLKNEELINWHGHKITIREIPGHSAGSIAVLVDGKYLFSGDTIFKDYPTATRLPGGSTRDYKNITVPWINSLPENLIVFPGHTEPFLLKDCYIKRH